MKTRSRTAALIRPAIAFWLLLAAIATTAGIGRELWLAPRIGDLAAHQIGTFFVVACFLGTIALFVRRTHLDTGEAVAIGLAWLLGAVAFEFGFGHYVDGLTWSELLGDYDFTRGRLLLLVWVAIGAGPFTFARVLQDGLREERR